MSRQQELNVKVVLKRSSLDRANGVWVNGKRLKLVKSVTAHGETGQMPTITIELYPTHLDIELDDPEYTINDQVKVDE